MTDLETTRFHTSIDKKVLTFSSFSKGFLPITIDVIGVWCCAMEAVFLRSIEFKNESTSIHPYKYTLGIKVIILKITFNTNCTVSGQTMAKQWFSHKTKTCSKLKNLPFALKKLMSVDNSILKLMFKGSRNLKNWDSG